MSKDPLGMIDGPNLYAYVLNDPINYIDPTGTTILPSSGDSKLPTYSGSGDVGNVEEVNSPISSGQSAKLCKYAACAAIVKEEYRGLNDLLENQLNYVNSEIGALMNLKEDYIATHFEPIENQISELSDKLKSSEEAYEAIDSTMGRVWFQVPSRILGGDSLVWKNRLTRDEAQRRRNRLRNKDRNYNDSLKPHYEQLEFYENELGLLTSDEWEIIRAIGETENAINEDIKRRCGM